MARSGQPPRGHAISRVDTILPPPAPEIIDGEEEFEVDRILDYAIINKTPKWLVLWKGYPLESATWEPKSSLKNAKDALAEFEASRKRKT
jgi:hypothetical protein